MSSQEHMASTSQWATDTERGSYALYQAEHWLAWLVALVAIGLGVVGVLRGFGLIGTIGAGVDTQTDGMIWLIPAISASILALALHTSGHHRRTSASDQDMALMMFEHSLAYLMALAAIAGGVLGILVGFDVFNNGNTPQDGFIWSVASIGASVLTVTLHTVRHHQVAEDTDVIVAMVEQRMAPASRTGMPASTAEERRPGTA